MCIRDSTHSSSWQIDVHGDALHPGEGVVGFLGLLVRHGGQFIFSLYFAENGLNVVIVKEKDVLFRHQVCLLYTSRCV